MRVRRLIRAWSGMFSRYWSGRFLRAAQRDLFDEVNQDLGGEG